MTRKFRAHLPTKSGNYRGYTWNCLARILFQSKAYRCFLGLPAYPEKSCAFFANQTPGGWGSTPLRLLACRPSFMTSQAPRVVTEVGENTNSNVRMTKSPFPQNRPPKKQEQTRQHFFANIILDQFFWNKIYIKCSQFTSRKICHPFGILANTPKPSEMLKGWGTFEGTAMVRDSAELVSG